MTEFLTDELKALASAYSSQTTQVNKIWSISAILLLSVSAVQFGPETETTKLFGIPLSSIWFYFAAAVISIFLNFSFCATYIQNMKVAEMYGDFIEGLEGKDAVFAESTSTKHTYNDFAHQLYISANNRFYPIKAVFDESPKFCKFTSHRFIVYYFVRFKPVLDAFYTSVPSLIIVVSTTKILLLGYYISTLLLILGALVLVLPPWLAVQIKNAHWTNTRYMKNNTEDCRPPTS